MQCCIYDFVDTSKRPESPGTAPQIHARLPQHDPHVSHLSNPNPITPLRIRVAMADETSINFGQIFPLVHIPDFTIHTIIKPECCRKTGQPGACGNRSPDVPATGQADHHVGLAKEWRKCAGYNGEDIVREES